jgi:Domain of unknown function (DUF4864)
VALSVNTLPAILSLNYSGFFCNFTVIFLPIRRFLDLLFIHFTTLIMTPQQHSNPNNPLPQPAPNLSPAEVIRIQMEALQQNDSRTDAGIETAFQFTSPGNKTYTGPLSRFKQIVRNPAFSVLLNHHNAEYDNVHISGDLAQQRVTISGKNGQTVIYTFILSRQHDNKYNDCWMTDGVSIDAMFWLN